VIVVGTKAYRSNEKGKGYQDIEASSLMQMIGRAGRPGLDSTGVAVVLTDNNSKKRIENLLDTGFGPAKSSLCA
jgi:replicative superfamily II helicase